MNSKIILTIVVTASLVFYWLVLRPQQAYYYAHHVDIQGTYLIKPIEIKDFELTDHEGHMFTQNNLKNHWTFLFFGFTSCNNVCPTTLSILNKTYKIIQKNLPKKDWPQVVFATIDPEHDTLSRLRNYIHSFNINFMAARTTPEKTMALKKQFNISIIKEKNIIDHSPEILLINPEAKIQAYFSYPQQSEKLAKDYSSIVNKHIKI